MSQFTVVITGGAGFLGDRLARALLAAPALTVAGETGTLGELRLVDRVASSIVDPRVTSYVGDLSVLLDESPALLAGADVVVHLAAVVSGEAEADFDLGMAVNLDGSRTLLEACRALGTQPVLLFASSLAVFGSTPLQPLPAVIEDTTLPTPQGSYGAQKFIGEQLVSEYGRRGFVRARVTRLMTVSVRPGLPNAAASSFLSGIIREPLAGVRAVCPVQPDTPVAISSPAKTIEGIVAAIAASDETWGPLTALNLPSLTTTPAEMADALDRVTGTATSELIDWSPDPAIEAIVSVWPSRFRTTRATALGLAPEPDVDTIIRAYVAELSPIQ